MNQRPPVSGVARNPFIGLRASEMQTVPLGITIASLAPEAKGVLMCRVNGEWLLRESWESETLYGDVIEWYDVPQDNDTLRGVLQIAAIVAINYFFPGLTPFQLFAASFAASTALNLLLPPTQQERNSPQRTGDNFTASLSGNEARLDQPIWKICGRREINPPFACQPYYEYRARPDAVDANLDHDQYFYALYAVGVGNYDVIAKIANTPISRFGDVLVARYLPPGTAPTGVLANVTTATEVSGQILESGRFVGGFAACAAQRTCAAIGIDIAATRGLGNGGDPRTVSWRVDFRPINDFGQVLGPWQTLATESRTGYTATPQRWSYRYELSTGSPPLLATAQRVEVRVVRTDVQDTSAGALHELAWIGLRAYLAEPAPLNADTAHYEVVMRASSQLSNLSSRDLRLIVQGYCRTWTPGGGWDIEDAIRNPAWWMLDLATSPTWGINKPDERIDLQSFYELALLCDERQDRFDWVFDSATSAWDALQLIARTCRSRVFRRNGVLSVARDELVTVPVTAFAPRNCKPGMQINETHRTRKTPDAIVIEYQDHRTWEWTEIECALPGVTSPTNPVRKRIEGVVGAKHAEREGRYEAANLLYRTRQVQFTTEMQGMLPAYMSPVDFVGDVRGYGTSGDVVNVSGNVLQLSDQPDYSLGELYITLIKPDGIPAQEILVSPGSNPYEVILATAPGFTISVEDGLTERTKYLLGPKDLVKIIAIEDGGRDDQGVQLYRLTGVIDDERVHAADVSLLPGPGEIQDPIGNPDDSDSEGGGGGGLLVVPRIDDAEWDAITNSTVDTTDLAITVTFDKNGALHVDVLAMGVTLNYLPGGQWNLYGPIEPSLAGQYEIRATLTLSTDWPTSDNEFTGTLDTWQTLDVDRVWELRNHYVDSSDPRQAIRFVRFEIREAATEIVQDAGTLQLFTFFDAGPGGSGGG